VAYTYSDSAPVNYFYFKSEQLKNGSFILSSRPKLDPKKMASTESMDIPMRDGTIIHAYLTWPNVESSEKLPVVVVPHGGPHGIRDYWGFDWEIQLLASRGYSVLQVNFRGSGGFGEAFEQAGHGQWGALMQDDITDATNWLIEQKIADPKRICIFGASYGGYAALMGVIREPKLYRCAIGTMGVYDLPLMFKEGDIADRESGLVYLRKVLGEDLASLINRSPVHNVNKIEAKLLLIHGKQDKRAPIEHAQNLMSALDKSNKPYQWLEIWNEGHGFSYLNNRNKMYSKVLDFLDQNIGSKSQQ